jgi:signal transduction histidine kinase/ligand-binding sensor domain-containing protein
MVQIQLPTDCVGWTNDTVRWRRMREAIQHRHMLMVGLALACLLACCSSAFALNPSLDVSQYAHTSWKIRDGFTKGAINAIAQTPDGYLWLGTEFGLVRFDGIQSVPWQPPNNQQLPSTDIRSLLVTRDGTLWIGTASGLASWKDRKLAQYAELTGQSIFSLLEDREATLWVGSAAVPTGRLCSIQNSSVKCVGNDGSLGRGVAALFEDSGGNLWLGVETGLWRWKPGPPMFYPLAGDNGIRAIGEADGNLLIGWKREIHRLIDGNTELYKLPGSVGPFNAKRVLRDRDGAVWIGTQDRGVVHVHMGRTEVFGPADGLSSENVHALFQDLEGNIWIGTPSGLDRFREFAVATLNVNHGLSGTVVGAVLAARDGSVWISTYGGLNRWHDGQMTAYHERANPTSTGVREIVGSGLPDRGLRSLFEDDRGRVWVSTVREIGYMENDRFIPLKGVPGGTIVSIDQDKMGDLWIVNEELGLFHLLRGGEVKQISWAALGHKDHVSTLAADPFQGGVWLGFHLGGVAYFNDKIQASYTAADGLSPGRVNHLRFDQSGALWAATTGGLSRLKNGQLATVNSKNGLPCDTVHSVIEDDTHSFWLNTACGLVRIAQPKLAAWVAAVDNANHSQARIEVNTFDSSDGARMVSAGSHYSPKVTRSTDGRLWFQTVEGVSIIDPHHLAFNSVPPPVHVEQLTADRKTYDVSDATTGSLRLPPLIRDLEIDYTALSLVAPEKTLFRYMLEGYDQDWQDAGKRRQAFYNNLRPGTYRFRVMACNNSGVWNEAGTFLDFYIAPAYYQTTWFRVLAIVVFLLGLVLIYQLRLQQVARQVRGRMQERLDERERIARDLHDTLLQSVQGLILKLDAGVKKIPKDEPARESMEKALDYADEVLAEGRDRVRSLRTDTIATGGLPMAFQRVAEETPQGSDVMFKTVVEGNVRPLHQMVREESYCIGREALVNALTHSGGRHVEVEITYDPRQFRLRIRDDGRGLDPKILKEGRQDHWGLKGMQERAARIGAQLNLWSRPDTGTEVELTVPGATAYRAAESKSKNFWSRS